MTTKSFSGPKKGVLWSASVLYRPRMPYSLPQLPYEPDALEPFIDAPTMLLHHGKHHQTYVDKLNEVVAKHPQLADQPLEHLLATIDTLGIPDADKRAIRNHGGGHANHTLFWQIMGPKKAVDSRLVDEIAKAWGSVATFQTEFSQIAMGIFGSGWAWLVRKPDNSLTAYSTPNQDSPVMTGDRPIFGLDVWEHAYYLKYQNKRADYIAAWWHVLKLLP